MTNLIATPFILFVALITLTGLIMIALGRLPVRKIFGWVLVVVFLLTTRHFVIAQEGRPGDGESVIKGYVINADTDQPPPVGQSITILINGWLPVYSGANGEWNITGLGLGDYTIELTELPKGVSPLQPKQTYRLSGGPTDVVSVTLRYHTGLPVTTVSTTTLSLTQTQASSQAARVSPLGPTDPPPPATPTSSTLPAEAGQGWTIFESMW